MTSFGLHGRHVIVTGAAAGIGRAITELLVSQGAHVHMVDRDATGLRGLTDTADAYVTDLADRQQLHALAARLSEAVPQLDGLVNNAAIVPRQWLIDLDEDEFDQCIGINLAAPIQLVRAMAKPLAAARGAVVNITSIHARTTAPGLAAYAASKAGLTGVTRALALELGPRHVRVNAIAPGYIDTGYVASYPTGVADSIRRQHPLQRLGEATDVAGVVAFLLSDAADFITGAVIPVDGGLCARMSAVVADWAPADDA